MSILGGIERLFHAPRRARAVVHRDGFRLLRWRRVLADVRWDRVDSVLAYPHGDRRRAETLLAFVVRAGADDPPSRVVVRQTTAGWDELVSALPRAFPSMTADWAERVASVQRGQAEIHAELRRNVVLEYVANPVRVWPPQP